MAKLGDCSANDSILIHSTSFVKANFNILGYDSCSKEIKFIFLDTSHFNYWIVNLDTLIDRQPSYFGYKSEGNYVFTYITNPKSNCADTLTKSILVHKVEELRPNVFTPNGDGVNDIIDFSTFTICEEFFELSILNRWGTLLYKSQNKKDFFWNGTTDEKLPVADGVYFYSLITSKNKYHEQ